ncbi:MAG: peptidase S8, partial [Gemmatimonadaceae bacterium]|nr:peptidase S8 [Gloeobacterales cyanobacterium ES-bin-141]
TDGRLFTFKYVEADRYKAQVFLDSLESSEVVQFAEPNYIYQASAVPNDPLYPRQWHLKAIDMEKAWTRADGEGAVVAVIDTGVAAGLPDLAQTRFVRGYDFVNDDDDATDDQGHGSHVAGTVAQSTNNREGAAGVAYRARIMPIKVLNRYGSGTAADVAEGIKLAADRGANVINLSLGGGADSALLRDAVGYARRKGVVLVCAAGNANTPRSGYPAMYGDCLSVSAFGPDRSRAFYSSYGQGVDIGAPGGDKRRDGEAGGVLQNTVTPEGKSVYASYQGTSMAAPHVAGVAALLYSHGLHDPALIRKALLGSARPVADDIRNEHGNGQLNAAQALDLVESPHVYWRGGFSWLVPLSTVLVGTILGLVLRLVGGRPVNQIACALGFVVMGLGFFPLEALGTFWGPEGLLALLASPVPQWDRVLLGGWLNPILHTVLLPGLLSVLLSGSSWGRSLAVGAWIGTAALLLVEGTLFFVPFYIPLIPNTPLIYLAQEPYARGFLIANGLACLIIAGITRHSGD